MAGNTDRPRALRYRSQTVRQVANRTGTAAETIGPLAPGDAVTGVTFGQFSSIDAVEHMVNELGPADISISTWTSGIRDCERAAVLRANGKLRGVRVLLDRATFEKSPEHAGPLIEHLGVDAFRCFSVHAKVAIVTGVRGSAVLRTSANFNKATRLEQFDINVDEEIAAFHLDWFDAAWDASGRTRDNKAILSAIFDRFLGLPRDLDLTPKPARLPRFTLGPGWD